jgi:hypothetical protein
MPRPRKSRLAPSLVTFAEELMRLVGVEVARRVADATGTLGDELRALRAEVRRLRAVERQASRGRPPRGRGRPRSTKVCSARGCSEPHVARGLCKNHYQRLRYAERNGKR